MFSIDHIGFKPCDGSPHRLQEFEEAHDELLQVFLEDGFCIAVFRFGAVALPEETEGQLRELIGKEVGCLRLDGRYYLREVVAGA
jgi:hypothetical protein